MKTIFIISPTRSGSTLLWKILTQHKEISSNLTESFIMFPLLYGRSDKEKPLTAFAKSIYQSRAQDFINALPEGQRDFDQSFQNFAMELYQKANGINTYCVDKSPGGYLFILEELLNRFPNQKFIFLFRNPLAIAASMSRTFNNENISILMDNGVLNNGYKNMLRIHAQGQYREQIHAINYENLITNPDKTLKDAYKFLELNYDQDDISGWEDNKIKGMGDFWGEENYQTFSPHPLEKYKTFYQTPFRQVWAKKFLRSINTDHLKHAGYDPEDLMASIAECSINWTLSIKDIKHGGAKKLKIIARSMAHSLLSFATSPFSIKTQIVKKLKKYVTRTKLKKTLILSIVNACKHHDQLRGIKPLSFLELPGEQTNYLNGDGAYPNRGNYIQVFPYDFTVEAKNCRLSPFAFYSNNQHRLCFGREGVNYAPVKIRNFTADTLKLGFFLHDFDMAPKLFLKNFLLDRWKIINKCAPDRVFERAIVINCFWKAYGHFIHDATPMIDQAINEIPKKYPDYKNVPIIIMANPTYHLSVLTGLGYDLDRFVFLGAAQNFTVRSALFHLIGSRESNEVSKILNKVKKRINTPNITTNKRIFIDRKNANGRILKGKERQKIMDLLNKYSIKPIILEEHSFEEQAAIMDGADLILGWHGSGMANMHMTSQKKTAVILYESQKDYRLQKSYDKILPSHIHQEHLVLSTKNVKGKRLEAKLNSLCFQDS